MSIVPKNFIQETNNTDKMPIDWFANQYERKFLNIEPPYQRDAKLWPETAKTQLIQSILGGILIPPIVLNKTGTKPNELYTVIDGKQRLTTIIDFMQNKLKFYNEGNPTLFCKFSDLSPEWQNLFKITNLSTYIYSNLDEKTEREIFERINHGVILSVGEKIKGLNSPWIPCIRNLVDKIGSKLINLKINNKRSRHYDCVVTIIALVNKDYKYVSKGKLSLQYLKVNKYVEQNMELTQQKIITIVNSLLKIYNKCCNTVTERGYNKCKWNWKQILVYIYMLNIGTEKESKKIERVAKYILHKEYKCQFLNEHTNDYEKILDNNMKEIRGTNGKKFFETKSKLINNLYKYISKKNNTQQFREKVYAKSRTAGESICIFCKHHKIYLTCFEMGHIISKDNGGTYELQNLFPLCTTCNGPSGMGTMDMDLYIKKKKLDIQIQTLL